MSTAQTLPTELTIYTVSEIYQHLMQLVSDRVKSTPANEQKVLAIQASAVADIDAAGLQLLISMSRYLSARDVRLVLEEASERLVRACTMLGLTHLLPPQTAGAEHGQ